MAYSITPDTSRKISPVTHNSMLCRSYSILAREVAGLAD
jgi:hypothetical protein